MTEKNKYIVIRVPPVGEDAFNERFSESLKLLEEKFPDREIIKIPVDLPVEFVD
jgi:hypothetical protein